MVKLLSNEDIDKLAKRTVIEYMNKCNCHTNDEAKYAAEKIIAASVSVLKKLQKTNNKVPTIQ